MCDTCDITIQQESKSKGFGELLVMERRYDPTRTLTARNRFAREMRTRFNRLQREIREAIVDKDVFALKEEKSLRNPLTQVERRAFNFPRSQDKVSAFMEWLQGRVNNGILEIREGQQLGSAVEDAWTNQYIEDSYKRGVQRARYEMRKAGYPVPSIEDTGGVQAAMNTPFHMDRVGLLYTRVYSDLKGVTNAMDTQISRVLSQGMADGDGPRLLARKINATISGAGAGDLGISDTLGRFIPAKRRAEMIARTEIIRSHHQATIQEYKNWRVAGVKVKAEWRTAGDARVCEQCEMLEASEWTLEEIENVIPVHPNCRCLALPLDVTDASKVADERSEELWADIEDLPEIQKNAFTYLIEDDISRIGINSISFEGLSKVPALKRINEAGKVIGNEILAKLPKIKSPALKNKASIELSYHHKYARGSGNGIGAYVPDLAEMRFGKEGILRMARTSKPSYGKWSVDNSFGGVVSHEYGHHVYFKVLDAPQRIQWKKFFRDKGGDNNLYFQRNVSRYGASNDMEAFAESFSAYVHPGYKAGSLPQEVESLLKNLIGSKIGL